MAILVFWPFICNFSLCFLLFLQAQKAKDKEESEQLMEDLDKSFTSLVQSKALFSVTDPGKMNALKSFVNKSIPNEQLKKDLFPATQSLGTPNQVTFYMDILCKPCQFFNQLALCYSFWDQPMSLMSIVNFWDSFFAVVSSYLRVFHCFELGISCPLVLKKAICNFGY